MDFFVPNDEEIFLLTGEKDPYKNVQMLVDAGVKTAVVKIGKDGCLVGTKDGTAVPSTDPQYHNNSKYWSDLAAQYAAQFGSAVKWRGSVAFANIPTSGMANGELYDISDSFTTDSRFVVGPGVSEPAGTDIIWNETASKWDIDTPSGVTSFNGRMGAVTPQSGDYSKGDVGLGNVDNTSDLNKPISTATQTALDGKMKKATGTAGQFVGYDSNGDPEAQSLPVMTGATTLANGEAGLVPAPTVSDREKFLGGDGAWHTPAGSGSGHTIMDENGNTFTNRPVLQFMDSDVTDDSEHDRTIITPHGGTTIVQIPSVVGTTFTYTGSAIGPQVTGLDTEHITITGATATNVGSYTLTAALNDPSRMVWTDMTTGNKTFAYTITKMPITIPTVTGSFTYDGTEKSCTISPASSDYYTQTGTTASTNAGTFSITFELNDTANTEWSDGTITDKVKNWSIAKANQTISLSSYSVTVNGATSTAQVSVIGSQGAVRAISSMPTIASASVNGSTITITGLTNGSATISVSADATSNYNASNTVSVSVTANMYTLYGFHLDGTESNPASMISYQVQYNGANVKNYDYSPAAVNLTTGAMNPGSWNLTDDFFIPRSCMLKYDGTVDYYLDENDESKKADGTASDVANTSYGGNAMMEWGRDGKKIWMKIVPDSTPTNGATFYISDYQVDSGFHAYNFYDPDGNLIDHFYTPKYNGSLIDGKIRSLSGQTPCNNITVHNEANYAAANNMHNKNEWAPEEWVDRILINVLLMMIGKSSNTQAVFGAGYTYGTLSSASYLAASGTLNGKGQWFGSTTKNDKTKGVKVFGMEHWWGNIWRRMLGLLNVQGTIKYKLTYSQVDGSTQTGYDFTGAGYKTVSDSTPSGNTGAYVSVSTFTPDGIFPKTTSGSATTYYCDGLWYNNSITGIAAGGGPLSDTLCGSSALLLNYAYADTAFYIGASLSCRPLAPS